MCEIGARALQIAAETIVLEILRAIVISKKRENFIGEKYKTI